MSLFLKKLAEKSQANHPAEAQQPLTVRLEAWHRSLPPVAQQRAFSMAEFVAATGVNHRKIGPALTSLGWHRGRIWSAKTYARFWYPPASG